MDLAIISMFNTQGFLFETQNYITGYNVDNAIIYFHRTKIFFYS